MNPPRPWHRSPRRSRLLRLSIELERWRELEREGRLSLARPALGWIRTVRDALSMSGFQLARRMGVEQPTVARFEQNERDGTITLSTLERAASALGCDVVYAFVPRAPLVERVEQQAERAARHYADASSATFEQDVQDCARELLVLSPGRIWGSLDDPELLRDEPVPAIAARAPAAVSLPHQIDPRRGGDSCLVTSSPRSASSRPSSCRQA